jgi:hypothetical protein
MSTSTTEVVRAGELPAMESTSRKLVPVWQPRQVATQDVDCECPSHEASTYPKAPVMVHPSPVRARIGLSAVAAISFGVVFIARQFPSISAEYSPRRAARLQHAL